MLIVCQLVFVWVYRTFAHFFTSIHTERCHISILLFDLIIRIEERIYHSYHSGAESVAPAQIEVDIWAREESSIQAEPLRIK